MSKKSQSKSSKTSAKANALKQPFSRGVPMSRRPPRQPGR